MEEKEQRLDLELPSSLTIEGDGRRLGQAIVNLLANANEHTPAGTRITVAGCAAGEEVRLDVADNGPGIPERELERVFDRFHRLATGGRGSGLGLPLARGIVELHGGRLWAERRPEGGTVFRLVLPSDEERGSP
jgi:signal transduction histidine kinase